MSMRKILGMTTLTASLLAAAPLLAQRGEGPSGGRSGGRHFAGGPAGTHFDVRQLMRLGHRLELTEDQRAAFREVLAAERAENAPVVDELKSNRKAVAELTRNGAFSENEAQVTELIQRQGDLLVVLALSRERIKESFFDLLTEDQLVTLEELRSNAPRRGRRPGGGPPSGPAV